MIKLKLMYLDEDYEGHPEEGLLTFVTLTCLIIITINNNKHIPSRSIQVDRYITVQRCNYNDMRIAELNV